jgi:hypothetical protein
MMTAEECRAKAAACEQEAYDSFERCDTDGFVSQWANDLSAQKYRQQAYIEENGGVWTFRAVFDLEGNLVAAKEIRTRTGDYCWGILDSDDPNGNFTGFFWQSWANNPKVQDRNNAKKGYAVGRVEAPAKAAFVGSGKGLSGSCSVAVLRADGGFSRDVKVLARNAREWDQYEGGD